MEKIPSCIKKALKQKALISSNGIVWAAHNTKSLLAPMGLTWVVNLGYDLFMRMAHHLACKIKPMGFNWAASASYAGGCYSKSTDWTDPPVGPPVSFFNKLNVIKTNRWRHEGNTKS